MSFEVTETHPKGTINMAPKTTIKVKPQYMYLGQQGTVVHCYTADNWAYTLSILLWKRAVYLNEWFVAQHGESIWSDPWYKLFWLSHTTKHGM